MITEETRNFWGKIDAPELDRCWIWIGARNSAGYGVFGKPAKYAHRLMWEFYFGEIPNGMFICHKCDNPSCVSPGHLFMGTHSDNMKDRNRKGRSNIPKGEKHPMAKLSLNDATKIKELYKNREYSQYKLAEMFHVHVMTINNIVNGKIWL